MCGCATSPCSRTSPPHGDEQINYVQIQAGTTGAASSESTSHVKDIDLEANGVAGLYPSYTFG